MQVLSFGRHHYARVQNSLAIVLQVAFLQEEQVIVVHCNVLHLDWHHVRLHDALQLRFAHLRVLAGVLLDVLIYDVKPGVSNVLAAADPQRIQGLLRDARFGVSVVHQLFRVDESHF